jgi:hypothetical protein
VSGVNGQIFVPVTKLVAVERKFVLENVSVEPKMMNLNIILKILEDQHPTVSLAAKPNVKLSV